MKLYKWMPPGAKLRTELALCGLAAFALIFCWSAGFLTAYQDALSQLYTTRYGVRVLRASVMIVPVNELLRHRFAGLWGYALCCLGLAAAHYASFHRESKSIYVMKRIPRAGELHVRALALPVAALAAGILLAALLLSVYLLVYFCATPAQCIPGAAALDIWEVL